MIGLRRLLRHLAWSDAKMFDSLIALPPAALDARYSQTAWPVGQLAMHIVGGAEWYCYCLAGRQWTDLTPPENASDLKSLQEHVADLNVQLVAEAELPDAVVTFIDEDGERSALRSTLLSQAVLHSIEHRTQIAMALEVSGFDGLVLDDFDLWTFERIDSH